MDIRYVGDIEAVGRIATVPTILDVVCRTTGMGFAAVARVTDDKWIICLSLDHVDFGLKPGDELQLDTTICNEIRQSREPVVINHVAENSTFCSHPTPKMYGFQSYISMPIIRADGAFFGTLCAIDPLPAKLENPETIGMFKLFAELIANNLDADERLATAESDLRSERQIAVLREQFIAVLGHDLRNPLASIDAGMRMLLKRTLDERAREIVTLAQGSVVRMKGLIDNVLDLARSRLGEGLPVDRNADYPFEPVVRQVVDELQAAYPDRDIEVFVDLDDPIDCDRQRFAQMLSNLLANAITHGAVDRSITIEITDAGGDFTMSVTNAGKPIPEEALENLFKPFFRADVRTSQQGLGLGLYISNEIAKAHGGTLTCRSDNDATTFTFEMPIAEL